MSWDDPTRLRQYLGEVIPEGGSDADTYFSDAQITGLLTDTSGDLRQSAQLGWQMKAANYANLITVSEGNALRQMSDLLDHAMKMVKMYDGSGTILTAGRTRIGRIRRFNA